MSGADGISRVLAAYIHELCVGGEHRSLVVQQFMGNVAETGPPGWDTAEVKSTERGGKEDTSEWDVCATFLVLPAVLLGRVGNESHTEDLPRRGCHAENATYSIYCHSHADLL